MIDLQQQLKEQERGLIAREIHDALGGNLTALKIGLSWLCDNLDAERAQLMDKSVSLSDLADSCLDTVRKISRDLRIGLLDDVGLVAALDWQVREFGKQSAIACEWHHDQAAQDFSFNPEAGTALFRICQEALTNVSRHAGATKATVRLAVADAIVLCIEDNGKGITAEQIASPRAFGLLGMKERLLPLGGRLDISSGKERGTIIRATMPTESARRRDND